MSSETLRAECDRFCADASAYLRKFAGSRFASLYLKGSFVTGQATEFSDIDLVLVLVGKDSTLSKADVDQLRAKLIRNAGRMVDLSIIHLVNPAGLRTPFLENAELIAGYEVRNASLTIPMDTLRGRYERMVLHAIRVVRGLPAQLVLPLQYPKPSADYFGYAEYGFQTTLQEYRPGFHHWLNLLLSIGSHRLFLEQGTVPPSKHDVVTACAHLSDSSFAQSVKRAYTLCRGKLDCALPNDNVTQNALRELCAATLAWENQFTSELKQKMPPADQKITD